MTGFDVELLAGAGSVERLPGLLVERGPGRILVVGGRTALERFDARRRLRGFRVERFTDFTPNPTLDQALPGVAFAATWRPDLVLGVGGGSAMDMAKLLRGLPATRREALAVLGGQGVPHRRAPLVLVPTVAGSGSEVTAFATVYVDGLKRSLNHPSVHADIAVVDHLLTHSCPAEVTWSGALDALAHGVESLWALGSTAHSRSLAAGAVAEVVGVLGAARWPLPGPARATLSAAAVRAGLAIDITRTTAAHAFAYPLTTRFGVRHGLACALNLAWLLPFTAERLAERCRDPRGAAFVSRRLEELATLLDAAPPDTAVAQLIGAAGFSPWLADHGVTAGDLPTVLAEALGSDRSGNGPVLLEAAEVLPRLAARLSPG